MIFRFQPTDLSYFDHLSCLSTCTEKETWSNLLNSSTVTLKSTCYVVSIATPNTLDTHDTHDTYHTHDASNVYDAHFVY